MIPNDIDTRAPVISRHSIVIDAPLAAVWRLHTDVDAWPDWQPDIETARVDGPFALGSALSWHTSGLDIESTIYRVEPRHRTLWGGPAHGILGMYEWTFVPERVGVRVSTAKSWGRACLPERRRGPGGALGAPEARAAGPAGHRASGGPGTPAGPVRRGREAKGLGAWNTVQGQMSFPSTSPGGYYAAPGEPP